MRNFVILLFIWLIQSCVFVIPEVKELPEIGENSNAAIWDGRRWVVDGLVDSSDSLVLHELAKRGTGILYAFDGNGVRFAKNCSLPTLFFSQGNADSCMSFNLFVGTREEDRFSLKEKDALAYIRFMLHNNLKGYKLDVFGAKIMNVAKSGTFLLPELESDGFWTYVDNYGSIDVMNTRTQINYGDSCLWPKEEIPVIPQKLVAWNTMNIPDGGGGCYLLVDCKITNENDNSILWDGDGYYKLAIPVKGSLSVGEMTIVDITLEEWGEWYDIRGNSPYNVLQFITFNPSVGEWENQNNNN